MSSFTPIPLISLQEAQVTIECVIHHKYHRSVLGAKGCNVQAVTQDHNVAIKFPEREGQKGEAAQKGEGAQTSEPAVVTNGVEGEVATPDPRDVIFITGRKENAEAAKQALLVGTGGGGVRWGRGGCVVEGEGLDGEGEGVLWRGRG